MFDESDLIITSLDLWTDLQLYEWAWLGIERAGRVWCGSSSIRIFRVAAHMRRNSSYQGGKRPGPRPSADVLHPTV